MGSELFETSDSVVVAKASKSDVGANVSGPWEVAHGPLLLEGHAQAELTNTDDHTNEVMILVRRHEPRWRDPPKRRFRVSTDKQD